MAEETQKHAGEIYQHDSSSCRHYAEFELLSYADHSGAVGEQKAKECTKRQPCRLHCDSMKLLVEHCRKTANHQTLEKRVDRRCHWRPVLLEYCYQCCNKAAESADQDPRSDFLACSDLTPGPRCCRKEAKEEDAGLVNRSLDRHRFGADIPDSSKCLRIQRRVGRSHQSHGIN